MGDVYIIETRYNRWEKAKMFNMINRVVGIIVKKFTIAKTVFFRIPLKVNGCREFRWIIFYMSILAIIGVCMPNGLSY